MKNQYSFRITTTLLPTDTTAKTTQVINKVDQGGNKFYPSFTEETVVLTNDDRTIMETTKAHTDPSNPGTLIFDKRGLSDDDTETVYENRKLTWNPGSLAFVTAGAGDWIDKDDDITWTGKQTYLSGAEFNGALVTKKGVKYPSFASEEALNNYSSPFGGMFATVDDTGELYRYNAVTEQRDLVSTVELGQYIIRVDDDGPAPGTADTIVTLAPALHTVYLGDNDIVGVRVDEEPAEGTPDTIVTVSPENKTVYVGETAAVRQMPITEVLSAGSASAAGNPMSTTVTAESFTAEYTGQFTLISFVKTSGNTYCTQPYVYFGKSGSETSKAFSESGANDFYVRSVNINAGETVVLKVQSGDGASYSGGSVVPQGIGISYAIMGPT